MPPETPPPAETQPPHVGKDGSPRLKRRRAWRTGAALVAVAGLAAALFAGTPLLRPADSDEGTLRGLQVRVLTISQAAAENRLDGALAALDALEKDLNDAAGQGHISLSRYRGIGGAVESVRADITNQLAAETAAVAPTGSTADVTPAAPEPAEAQQQVPVEPQLQVPVEPQPPVIVPAPAPAPVQVEPALPEPEKEAKGKGKGQGKP